jgi:gliding motility-associated-like protein
LKVSSKYFVFRFKALLIFCCTVLTSEAWSQCGITISSFPYHEDFETSDGGWTSGGANNDWVWGTPAKPVITGAGSGVKCWITGGATTSFYNFSERSYVESPCFNFSTLTDPFISLRIFWDTEYTYDGANLQYSVNGGVSWNNVGAYGDAIDCLNDNWYNFPSVNNLAALASVKNGWCGTIQPSNGSCVGGGGSGTWLQAKHSMPYLAGEPSVKFRFIFGAGTTCNSYDGFAFDDITIKNTTPSINVSPILKPSGCAIHDGSATLNVTGGLLPYSFAWIPNVSITNIATGLSAGNYTVTITDAAGCTKTNYFTINHTPAVSLTSISYPDTCQKKVGYAKIFAGNGTPPFTYLWNPSGNTTSIINNLSMGSYTVTVTDIEGCTSSENISISEYGAFTFNLGNDTTICSGNGFILSPGNFAQYNWQDSTIDSIYKVRSPGVYWVEVTSNAGCKSSDTLQVIEDCLHDIVIPNAFSPNNDGVNDIFIAEAISVKTFKMEIYNRWGEKIFLSNSINQGWKGNFKNHQCETGIYLWRIKYSVNGKDQKEKTGTVFLLE